MIFIVPLPNQVRVLSCHLYIITLENTSMYFQITRKEEFLIMSIIETKPVELIMTPQINYSDSVIYTLADMITHPLNKAVFITLYRCGKYSMVTNALIRAAETMHIPVCVYVETNAAGMKDDNKELAKYLRKHGCRVVTSTKNILGENKVKKVHFKACMNLADDASSFFYSTGNFSVPQGINSEDICTKILLNDDPNAFYDMYTVFRRIFNDVFDFDSYNEFILSKRNTTISKEWKTLRYIPSTSMRDITSVDEYYDAILNSIPYDRMSSVKLMHYLNNTPTEEHPIVIRMKTRSLSSAPFIKFIEKIESLYDMDEIEMHILVKDHIGDGVKDIIKKYPNTIHLYSGKLRHGYNWHSNYCIINESKLILTSCDTDNWKKRFELAMLIDKYSLTYSCTGIDPEHTLVDEFNAEIANSCYELYTTEPKSFIEDYSYDVPNK